MPCTSLFQSSFQSVGMRDFGMEVGLSVGGREAGDEVAVAVEVAVDVAVGVDSNDEDEQAPAPHTPPTINAPITAAKIMIPKNTFFLIMQHGDE